MRAAGPRSAAKRAGLLALALLPIGCTRPARDDAAPLASASAAAPIAPAWPELPRSAEAAAGLGESAFEQGNLADEWLGCLVDSLGKRLQLSIYVAFRSLCPVHRTEPQRRDCAVRRDPACGGAMGLAVRPDAQSGGDHPARAHSSLC